MKKNSKMTKVFSLIMTTTLLFSLVACATGEKTSSSSKQDNISSSNDLTSSSDTTDVPIEVSGEITWLMRSNPFENDWEENSVIPAFEELYPDSKVNMIIVPSDQVDTKLLALNAANTPPDVFSMWGDSGFMDYYNKGLLLDLTDLIERDLNKEDFLDGLFELYEVEGKYYHVPQVTNFSVIMAYNKDLFKESGIENLPTTWNDPSWTWEKMVEVAKKLTKNLGTPEAQYGVALDMTQIHQICYLFGEDPYPEEAYKTGVMDTTNINSPGVISTIQKMSDLIHVDKVHPSPAEKEALEQMGHIFKTGKVAMTTILPTQAYGNFKDVDFEWGIAPLPAGKPGEAKGTLYNGAYFISSKSKNTETAWALIKYMSTPEAAAKMSEITGFLVPLKESSEDWYKMMAEATGMESEEVKSVVSGYPVDTSVENANHLFCNWNEISTTVKQDLDAVWINNAPVSEVVEKLSVKLDDIVSEIKANVEKDK